MKSATDVFPVPGGPHNNKLLLKLIPKENDMRSVTLDSLRQKPFDKDSHLDIVDVKMPTDEYYEDMNLFHQIHLKIKYKVVPLHNRIIF